MNKRNYKIIIGIVFFAGLIALLNFCLPRKPVKSDSGYRLAMGTFARIVAIAPDANTARKAIEAAFEQIENIENLCSFYKSDSEVSEINRNAYDNPVVVSEITFEIIRKSIEFSRLSDGAFDITVGALEDLWRKAAKENLVPSQTDLENVHSKIGYEKIIIAPNDKSISFAADGIQIDLGAIAKGFAIDKAIEAAKKIGAIGAMVDIGGDIRCFGWSPDGKKFWQIGLQEPNPKSEDKSILTLKLNDFAVATSGDYQRFVLIDGKKYSHIMNTKTGKSSSGLASVSVICKSCTEADALATAVSVMGIEKGLCLIEQLPQTEAILIPAGSDEIIKTSGAEKFIPFRVINFRE